MATCSSILAWKIPLTEEPGGLQSMGCKESDLTEQSSMHACMHGHLKSMRYIRVSFGDNSSTKSCFLLIGKEYIRRYDFCEESYFGIFLSGIWVEKQQFKWLMIMRTNLVEF